MPLISVRHRHFFFTASERSCSDPNPASLSCRTADTQLPTAPHFNKLPHEGADKLLTSNPPRVCFPSVRFKHLWCPTQGSSVTRSGPAARRPGAESETPAAASLCARGDEAELWEAHIHFLLVAEAWKITAVQARSGSHINRATSNRLECGPWWMAMVRGAADQTAPLTAWLSV